MTEVPPEESGARGDRGRTAAVVAVMLVLGLGVPLAGLVIAWKSCAHTAMQGSVDVTGSTLGTWRSTLERCAATNAVVAPGSGEVELGRADDRTLVRFTLDPIDGPLLTLWPLSGDRTLSLRGRDCPALRTELRRTNPDEAPAPTFDGKVSGTCPLPDGGTVTIDVWFRGCN